MKGRIGWKMQCMIACAALLLICGAYAANGGRARWAEQASVEPIGYPRGPWWRGDVNHTLLGVSHILISHEGAARSASLLSIPGEVPKRSWLKAREMAIELRGRLRKDPSLFSGLAKQYSDDPTTAALGGVIGGVFAPHLPSPLVDALGNLRPGELSRVVETQLGFHILQRIALPAAQVLDASALVIGYDTSRTVLRPDRSVRRTRREAAELAAKLRAKLRADPELFDELAASQSDSFEAGSHGDYGQWSTHARSEEPTVLYVLSRLAPGQISEVLDTASGFRIMRRDARKERASFAITPLLVVYDHVGSLTTTRDVEAATAIAATISEQLRADPARFDALRSAHCDYDYCARPAERISSGTPAYVNLVAAIVTLPVGGVTIEPVPSAFGWVFARREDPALHPAAAPERVDLELPRLAPLTLAGATKAELTWYMNELRARSHAALTLDAARRQQLDRILDNLTLSYQTLDVTARAKVTAEASGELVAALGQEHATKFALVHEALLRELSGETVHRD